MSQIAVRQGSVRCGIAWYGWDACGLFRHGAAGMTRCYDSDDEIWQGWPRLGVAACGTVRRG